MRLLTALAWLASLAGCVNLNAPYPERRFYALETARSGSGRTPPAGALLRVRRFQASRGAEGSEFVTRRGENAWESDFWNGFFTPPASQVAEQTTRWLGASGLFAHVDPGSSFAEETHLLEGNVVSLHADLRDASKPAAVIEVQFVLLAVGAERPALLFQKGYRKEIPAAGATPGALARGWSAGLGSLLGDLEADLAQVDRSVK